MPRWATFAVRSCSVTRSSRWLSTSPPKTPNYFVEFVFRIAGCRCEYVVGLLVDAKDGLEGGTGARGLALQGSRSEARSQLVEGRLVAHFTDDGCRPETCPAQGGSKLGRRDQSGLAARGEGQALE